MGVGALGDADAGSGVGASVALERRVPEGVQVEFILRDHDNIAAGDADPTNEDYAPDVYYW